MTRRVRFAVFAVAGAGLAVVLALAFVQLPTFGGASHPYRDRAVRAAEQHETANVVSSVNFDQRGLDTLGEETILLASVIGVATLLRRTDEEHLRDPLPEARQLDAVHLLAPPALGIALVVGLSVVVHGHLTPGGGFQGGLVVATGALLVYLGGRYAFYERSIPTPVAEACEAAAVAAFALLGVAGLVAHDGFLANFLGRGTLGVLFSAGTVPLLNLAVGLEVAAGSVLVWSEFLAQEYVVRTGGEAS